MQALPPRPLLALSFSALLLLALDLPACSSDRGTILPDAGGTTSGDAASGSGGDGSTARDDGGISAGDADTLGTDAGATPRDGSASPTDARTTSLGPNCQALDACCPELPAGEAQTRCVGAVASGDEGMCGQGLDIAHIAGACTGGDAGPARDAGPLGPECAAYLDCCPSLPSAVQMFCTNNANAGDEGRCTQALGLVQQLGQCLPTADAGTNDAGPGDASDGSGVLGDASTSTTSVDAG